MTYSVGLQEPFAFAIKWLLIGIALLLLAFAIGLLIRSYGKNRQPEEGKERTPRRRRAWTARKRSLQNLESLEADLAAGRIDNRQAHLQLSREIRRFAHTMTGVHVENMTLSEIRKLNDPHLTGLMELCYASEFSPSGGTDAAKDIAKSKELISTWR